MKITLNEEETKKALEEFVQKNYLKDYDHFTVEVLDIMDADNVSLDLDNKITVELGVNKTSTHAAPAPCAPVAAPIKY